MAHAPPDSSRPTGRAAAVTRRQVRLPLTHYRAWNLNNGDKLEVVMQSCERQRLNVVVAP